MNNTIEKQSVEELISKAQTSGTTSIGDMNARAAIKALSKAGYVIVPVEPTAEMVEAGAVAEGDGNLAVEARNIYCAMLNSHGGRDE